MANGKPNILVIWGDDIGMANLSCYSHGLMGYQTPNIDRLAHEGMMFTDNYGEQSCTAGRAAFITGQSVFRTGLSKVGMPGADIGLRSEDPTTAELLKPLGYATGQFGKNHLGDRDEFLPTNHGFDEFFGNLYHLNAEQDPEHGPARMSFLTSTTTSDHAAYCIATPTDASRTPDLSASNAWRPSTTSSSGRQRTS
jgi:arylsulfatase A-like enzyme